MNTETVRSINPFHPANPDRAHYTARALKEAQKHAGDQPVSSVELNEDRSWYAFTTELGMYRLADKYPVKSKGYSTNLGTWYVHIGK